MKNLSKQQLIQIIRLSNWEEYYNSTLDAYNDLMSDPSLIVEYIPQIQQLNLQQLINN